MLERFLTVSGSSARLLRNKQPKPVPETQEYIDARTEARTLCRNLGLDVDNEHWDGSSVSDFIRLAYAQGYVACESRIGSPDMADAIALAIESPELVIEPLFLGQKPQAHVVRAVQQAVTYGVPKSKAAGDAA